MEYTNEFKPIHGNKSNQFTSSKMFLSFKFKSKALLKDCNRIIKKTQLQNHQKINKSGAVLQILILTFIYFYLRFIVLMKLPWLKISDKKIYILASPWYEWCVYWPVGP